MVLRKATRAAGSSDAHLTWLARLVCAAVLLYAVFHQGTLQVCIDDMWRYLLTNWVFKSVYFETWWVIVSYIAIVTLPYVMSKITLLDRYKLHQNNVDWDGTTGKIQMISETIEYATPFMILDTAIVKRYYDVDPTEWATRAADWIQTTRALPLEPPQLANLVFQLIGGLLIYDAFFCAIHYALHHYATLYRLVHAPHHDHVNMFGRVTNYLSLVERVALVLAANQSLKIMHAHPLTRAVFVPVFVGALVWLHSGYDIPWSFDKVVPFGLLAGCAEHYEHHRSGTAYYQPFLTYIDKYMIQKINNKSH